MKYDNLDDVRRFAAAINWLGEKFQRTVNGEPQPVRLSKPDMKDLFDALSDFPIQKIEWAAKEYFKEGKYFPKPRDIRELAKCAPAPQVENKPLRLLEDLTPPEEAREKLKEILQGLDDKFGTTLSEKVEG